MTETIHVHAVGGDSVAGAVAQLQKLPTEYQVYQGSQVDSWEWIQASSSDACLLLDGSPDWSQHSLDVLVKCQKLGVEIPTVVVGDSVATRDAVKLMECGASTVLEIPFEMQRLYDGISRCVAQRKTQWMLALEVADTKKHLEQLGKREYDVLELVCQGLMNRAIAKRLGLGLRTVESYRAKVLKRFEAESWQELIARLARFETCRPDPPALLPIKSIARQAGSNERSADGDQEDGNRELTYWPKQA